MSAELSSKGQSISEEAIREALSLQPDHVVVQKQIDDHVEVYFYPPEHRNSLRGLLAGKSKRTVSSAEWSSARESA